MKVIYLSEIVFENFIFHRFIENNYNLMKMEDLGEKEQHQYYELIFNDFRLEYCTKNGNPLYYMFEFDRAFFCLDSSEFNIINDGVLGSDSCQIKKFHNLRYISPNVLSGKYINLTIENSILTSIGYTY